MGTCVWCTIKQYYERCIMEFIEYYNGKPVRFLEHDNRLFVDTEDIGSLLDKSVH